MRPVRAAIAGLVVALVPAIASAHVNVESSRRKLKAQPFSALVDFSFGFSQGNINTLNISLEDRFSFSRGRHLLFFFNESGFASKTLARNRLGVNDLVPERYKNAHLGHARYSLRIKKWLAAEAFTQVQTNEFILIRTRILLGVTPRFTIFENDQFGVFAGPAYLGEYEDLDERFYVDQPGGFGNVNWWHRLGTMLTLSLTVHERAEIHTTTYAQPRFDAPGDLRVFNQGELSIEITEHFAFKLVATIAHDTRPPRLCTQLRVPGVDCAPSEILPVVPTDIALENVFSIDW